MSYQEVLTRMTQAAKRTGREREEICLVAVSKARTAEEIRVVYEMGHRDFGENRADEIAEKAARLPDDIRWHFVGTLQSNKARVVRPITHLLHSMDRESLATAWVKGQGPPPPVLIQVNTGAEPQKSGVLPDEAGAMVDLVASMGVQVRGLMTIPPIATPEVTRGHFRLLSELSESIQEEHPEVSELSMGMTDDFEVAIEEGASLIRVGRAIFGARN